MAASLAWQALEAGYAAYFTTLTDLVADPDAAHTGLLRKRLRHYERPKVLVIDEIGYTRLTPKQAHLLFELVKPRHPYYVVASWLHLTDTAETRYPQIMTIDP